MKRIIVCLLSLLLVTMFISALPCNASDEKTIAVVFTQDVHSHILSSGTDNIGGFARIATLVNQIRSENDETLLFDSGDFSMGTLYSTLFRTSAPELRIMGAMGYNAITLGNHEFDYGSDGLADMLNSAKQSNDALPKLLVPNIEWDKSESEYKDYLKKALDNYGASAYYVINLPNNKKAAVFGLIGNDAALYSENSNLSFSDYCTSAGKTVSEIKAIASPDLIICLSHSGNDGNGNGEDIELAKAVPDIDVIISGHSHTVLEEPVIVGNTHIVSCGEYGSNIGKLIFNYNESEITFKSYSMLKVDCEPNTEIAAICDNFSAEISAYLKLFGYDAFDNVLAYSPFDFASLNDIATSHDDQNLGNIISDSFIDAVKRAEGDDYEPIAAAAVPAGVIRSSIKKGEVTVSDIFDISPLGLGADGLPGYPLVSIYLYGSELKSIAEIDASVYDFMSSAQLYVSGMKYTFNNNRLIFNRVSECMLTDDNGNTTDIDNSKLYRVVGGFVSIQMLSAVNGKTFGLLQINPKDKDGNPIVDFNSVIIKNSLGDEVKEWKALADYISSFGKENGVSIIPQRYETDAGRKVLSQSKNIVELLKNPNKAFWLITGVAVLLLAVIVLIILLIAKKHKKSRKRKLSALYDN